MKLINFFQPAPHWITNSLTAVITLLITINQIIPQVSNLFGILDCQSCIATCQKILAIVAIILSILKIFTKVPEQINSDEPNLPKFENPPPVPTKG